MLKLIFSKNRQSKVYTFDKFPISIGSQGNVNIEEMPLNPLHVQIIDNQGSIFVHNCANDPFVALNGMAFGKKRFNNGDLLTIGDVSFRLEMQEGAIGTGASVATNQPILEKMIQKSLQSTSSEPRPTHEFSSLGTNFKDKAETEAPHPNETDEDKTDQEDESFSLMSESEVESLLQQVEDLNPGMHVPVFQPEADEIENDIDISVDDDLNEKAEEAGSVVAEMEKAPILSPANPQHKDSLKDYYLRELDDKPDLIPSLEKSQPAFISKIIQNKNWKMLGTLGLIFLSLMALITVAGYTGLIGRKSEEEIVAAASIADIAMALTYAERHHVKPQNQNWGDWEFIKNNLMAVIPAFNLEKTPLDIHHQFAESGYSLRVYTSSSLSHFLVIGQPAPTIFQWLFPRASVVIDSRRMELRKLSDIKALNRLLVNPAVLDEENLSEISHLVQQGELIPLASLDKVLKKAGFIPPKALALLRPGAENLVYNAPRYYLFGEPLLKKAVLLGSYRSSEYELGLLKQELESLSNYPNLVLYSSEGMQKAVQAQKYIHTFSPKLHYLVAYLIFNSNNTIIGSHLLVDGRGDNKGDLSHSNRDKGSLAYNDEHSYLRASTNDDSEDPDLFDTKKKIDKNDPAFCKLCELQSSQSKALEDLGIELASSFSNANSDEVVQFLDKLKILLEKSMKNSPANSERARKSEKLHHFVATVEEALTKYRGQKQAYDVRVNSALSRLCEEHSDWPLNDLIESIETSRVQPFIEQHVAAGDGFGEVDAAPYKEVDELIFKIKKSTSLNDLKQSVDKLSTLLHLDRFSNTKKLITLQAEVRVQVLDKLGDFLLSSDKALPTDEFKEENRAVLAHILKTAWVTDPDEFDFYINEFEVRANRAPS